MNLLASRLGDKVDHEQTMLLARLKTLTEENVSYVTFCQRVREAGYADPNALASDLAACQKITALADVTAQVVAAKGYLEGVVLPTGADKEMSADRAAILGQLQFSALAANPALWPSINDQYERFKDRYRSLYQIHHRDYNAQVAKLREQVEKTTRELDALRRLNGITEIGEPVGAQLEIQRTQLLGQLQVCSITDVNAIDVNAEPSCMACRLKLTGQSPTTQVYSFLEDLHSALQEQLRRLSTVAIQRILTEGGGDRVEKFLKVLRASDLSTLINVLDDDLTTFIRTLLREANIQTEASSVLQMLAAKYPVVEEEKVAEVVEEFRQLLSKAFAEAQQKNRGKKIRISLK
jgi:hypothetical protein